jgi:hypothetical protein
MKKTRQHDERTGEEKNGRKSELKMTEISLRTEQNPRLNLHSFVHNKFELLKLQFAAECMDITWRRRPVGEKVCSRSWTALTTGQQDSYPIYSTERMLNFIHCVLYHLPYFPAHKTHFFSPEKCYLNSTCVLCTEGKYYFQTYKYPYSYYTSLSWDSEICF